MSRSYQAISRLKVSGFRCDPDQVTAILGVEPTRTSRMDDGALPHDDCEGNCWVKDSPAHPSRTTPQQSIAALLTLFADVFAFARLPQPVRIEVNVTLAGFHERPYFFLSTHHLTMLAMIGADLNMDLETSGSDAGEKAKGGRLTEA
jgi:hypothetical protein